VGLDVLIVGGGPAGLAAGITCARAGLSTLVCERGRYPIDKACGEGVMPTGRAALERLGVLERLDRSAAAPFTGIRYVSAKGAAAQADFAEGPGLAIRRTALSEALRAVARGVPDLEVRESCVVEAFERTTTGIVAIVGGERAHARLLVGADGLRSRVARRAGLAAPSRAGTRWGIRRHFRVDAAPSRVEVHWGPGVEAYVTPVGAHEVGVALLWDRRRWPRLPGGERAVEALLAPFPRVRAGLGAPVGEPMAVGPLAFPTRGVVADGVVLLGDAAGYVDAITGEGISLATAQVAALERTVVPVLRAASGPLRAGDLLPYERAVRAIQRPYAVVARFALFLSRHPTLAELAIGALARSPDAFRRLLSANMGLASPVGAILGAARHVVGGPPVSASRPSSR
jgi:2-polyprenyl-6-methoxyphenol hydroxylase-like FAD-dependent oxidoreductase